MTSHSSSPPNKRVKLEPKDDSEVSEKQRASPVNEDEEEDDALQCSICLQPLLDRAIIPTCAHEFCFDCILLWSERSRECPLCKQRIGEYVIHDIRSKYDFRKHHLPPPRSNSPPSSTSNFREETARRRRQARERERERERLRMLDEREQSDRLQDSIARRKWLYEHGIFAKHVGSNSYTRYRPFPTPAQFASSQDYIQRMTAFLRRELQIWNDLDVEFLTTFIISMMKSIDIRSESAIKLLSEFLDLDISYLEGERHPYAEHFAHEVYSYLRSPFRDLFVYDEAAQYDTAGLAAPPIRKRRDRWTNHRRSQTAHRSEPETPNSSHRPRSRSPVASSPPSLLERVVDHPIPSEDCTELPSDSSLRPPHSPQQEERGAQLNIANMGIFDAHSAGCHSSGNVLSNDTRAHAEHRREDDAVVDPRHQTGIRILGQHAQLIQENANSQNAVVDATQTPPSVDGHVPAGTSSALGQADPSDTLPSNPSTKKPPRARNLIQSVHAHLGPVLASPTHLGRPSTQPSNLRQADPQISVSPPALLARLSNPAPVSSDVDEPPGNAVVDSGSEVIDLDDDGENLGQNLGNSTSFGVPLARTSNYPRHLPATLPASGLPDQMGVFNSSLTTLVRDPRKDPSQSGNTSAVLTTQRSSQNWRSFDQDAPAIAAEARASVTVDQAPSSEAQSGLRNQGVNHEARIEDHLNHVDKTVMRGSSIGQSSPLNSTSITSQDELQDTNGRRATLLAKLLREKRQNSTAPTGCDSGDESSRVVSSRSRSEVNLGFDTELLTDSVKRGNLIKSTSSENNLASDTDSAHRLETELGKRVRLKARLAMEKRSLEP